MGLVDSHPLHAQAGQRGGQPFHGDAFGRDEQQPQLARAQQLPSAVVVLRRVVGIERGSRHTDGAHLLGLITHQGDQRRNHHRQAAIKQSRQLIAHALAAAGRHHRQNGRLVENG